MEKKIKSMGQKNDKMCRHLYTIFKKGNFSNYVRMYTLLIYSNKNSLNLLKVIYLNR